MVPTTLVNIVDPSTIAGIPSIMCGFAVLMAIFLSGKVLPQYHENRQGSLKPKSILAILGKRVRDIANRGS